MAKNRYVPESPTAPGIAIRMLWTMFWGLFVAVFMVLGYTGDLVVTRIFNYAVGFYGFWVTFHLMQQIAFANGNRRKVERRRAEAKSVHYKPRYALQSVGYRENADVLREQFVSVRDQTWQWERFLFVSDGNTVGKEHTDPRLKKAFANYSPSPKRVHKSEPGPLGKFMRIVFRVPDRILNFILLIMQAMLEILISIFSIPWWIKVFRDLSSGKLFRKAEQTVKEAVTPKADDDSYIAEVFLEIFPDGKILWIDFLMSEAVDDAQLLKKELALYNYIANQPKGTAICILQPKAGKREVMFTASRLLIGRRTEKGKARDEVAPLFPKILLTDSDTVLATNAAEELLYMHYRPTDKNGKRAPAVGAVTGDVRIYNVENFLSFMSSLRYWFAFNLERAAQSFFGSVTCVSGPLGMYDARCLDQILIPWINQTFMGLPTTFGDDRSLTNMSLANGWRVFYTHLAVCSTDTPVSIAIWRNQQERWNKSFLREFLINLTHLWRHHPWLTYDMVFQGFFPVFLILSMGNMIATAIRTQDWFYVGLWIVGILIGGFLRAFYAMFLNWNVTEEVTREDWFTGKKYKKTVHVRWRYFAFIGYGFLYVSILLITRIKAYITVGVTDWGTPPRREKVYAKTLSP